MTGGTRRAYALTRWLAEQQDISRATTSSRAVGGAGHLGHGERDQQRQQQVDDGDGGGQARPSAG